MLSFNLSIIPFRLWLLNRWKSPWSYECSLVSTGISGTWLPFWCFLQQSVYECTMRRGKRLGSCTHWTLCSSTSGYWRFSLSTNTWDLMSKSLESWLVMESKLARVGFWFVFFFHSFLYFGCCFNFCFSFLFCFVFVFNFFYLGGGSISSH